MERIYMKVYKTVYIYEVEIIFHCIYSRYFLYAAINTTCAKSTCGWILSFIGYFVLMFIYAIYMYVHTRMYMYMCAATVFMYKYIHSLHVKWMPRA